MGDDNSTYLHACLRKRRQQNQVCRISDTTGVRKENSNDVEDALLKYYRELLGSRSNERTHVSDTIIAEGSVTE